MNRVLVSYAPHMLRDQLLTRGAAMLVVAAVFIGLIPNESSRTSPATPRIRTMPSRR